MTSPVVLVACSLGSVTSYAVLPSNDAISIQRRGGVGERSDEARPNTGLCIAYAIEH